MPSRPDFAPRSIWSRLLAGVSAAPAAKREAAQEPTRWTCTYQHESGVRASATFDSARQALEFAEHHARLTAAPHREWEHVGDTWLLTTPAADYLVRRQRVPTEPPTSAAPPDLAQGQ